MLFILAEWPEIDKFMNISFSNLTPFTSVVFGILILVFPRFLNYLIAGYLILTGIIALGILR